MAEGKCKMEMDFKVIATSRGFPCIVLGSYKYRKIRETAAGEIVWRCTKKSCLAQVRTNLEQTEVRNVKDEHDHVGLDPFKLKRLLTYGEVNHLLRDSLRYSLNRSLEPTLEDSLEVPQQIHKPATEQNTNAKKNATQHPQQSTKQSATKNVAMQPVSPPPPLPQPQPEVCLRWNSHLTNMQSTFTTLLCNEQFVDVTLACEGRSIRCHKIILSACSSYFEELLSQNPCQHPIILMKDLKFWEVEALVDFMYKGEVNVGQDKLPSLLSAAEALQIKGLAGPITSSQDQNTFLPTVPMNLDGHTDESTTSSFTSHGTKKRKSVAASLCSTVTQPQNTISGNRSPFGQSHRESPEPSTSSYHTQEESYEPPNRRSRHFEVTTMQLEDIKIEPIEVDTEPVIDCFDIKEIDDGGGKTRGAQGFEEVAIANTPDCATVGDQGKNT